MTYNLTEKQKELARRIVRCMREGTLEETFAIQWSGKVRRAGFADVPDDEFDFLDQGGFAALVADSLLLESIRRESVPSFLSRKIEAHEFTVHVYTVTRRLFEAVDSGFVEERSAEIVSTLAHAAPPELNLSLDRLRKKYPDPAKLGFLIMRFTPGKVFEAIVAAIQETGAKYGIAIIRADEHGFHADLWGNVRTFLHGCSFGVAVYERIEQDEPNANVGLEVGYLLAMNKPVLLLKERTVKALQADLMGKLYKEFDEHDAAGSIPAQLERWLIDNGVIVPGGG